MRRLGLALAALGLAAAVRVGANPIPSSYVREWNEAMARWITQPNPEDEQRLIRVFGAYGLSPGLWSDSTLAPLEQNFDRFAPLFVAAQRPPFLPQSSLQRWFRAHADPAQSDSMTAALREWLTAKVTEAPAHGGTRIEFPEVAVQKAILGARMAAVEELGSWRDRKALPELQRMLDKYPSEKPVLTAAIRAITDESGSGFLGTSAGGGIRLHRKFSELDSLNIAYADEISRATFTWRADQRARKAIWSALSHGHETDRYGRRRLEESSSFEARLLTLSFQDGTVARLERNSAAWVYQENGRPHDRLDIDNQELSEVVAEELIRAGIAPAFPRFLAESVTLRLQPGEMQVTGVYEFEGTPHEGWLTLGYPIAEDADLGQPRIEMVELTSTSLRKRLPVRYEQSKSGYQILFDPAGSRRYELMILYHQSLGGRTAKYLVTTAKEWGRPLHRAWFQVIMDGALGEPHFELPFREVAEGEGRRRFLFEASPFRPERDLLVRW